MTSQHLRGVQWWDWVLSQARHLAQCLDKQTKGWNRGVTRDAASACHFVAHLLTLSGRANFAGE